MRHGVRLALLIQKLFFFFNFGPCETMPVNFSPPKIKRVKNLKNCRIVDFDSSKEGFYCTECNTKNLNSLQCTVSEINYKKHTKIGIFDKIGIFAMTHGRDHLSVFGRQFNSHNNPPCH